MEASRAVYISGRAICDQTTIQGRRFPFPKMSAVLNGLSLCYGVKLKRDSRHPARLFRHGQKGGYEGRKGMECGIWDMGYQRTVKRESGEGGEQGGNQGGR